MRAPEDAQRFLPIARLIKLKGHFVLLNEEADTAALHVRVVHDQHAQHGLRLPRLFRFRPAGRFLTDPCPR